MARSDDVDPATPKGDSTTPNPAWFKPLMLGFMLLGLVWVLVFYLSSSNYPIPGIGAWNLAIGFGIALVGFLMTTRWR